MLADSLKPDYYRSKGRPPPAGIADYNHHHHSLCCSSEATTPDDFDADGFPRQVSFSSASLLGDLNGKPFFYMPVFAFNSGDVDPLLVSTKTARTAESSRSGVSNSSLSPASISSPPDCSNDPLPLDFPLEIIVSQLSQPVPPASNRAVKSKSRRSAKKNGLPSPQPSSAEPLINPPKNKEKAKKTPNEDFKPKTEKSVDNDKKVKDDKDKQENVTVPSPIKVTERPVNVANEDDGEGEFTLVTGRKKNRQPRTVPKTATRATFPTRVSRPPVSKKPPQPPPSLTSKSTTKPPSSKSSLTTATLKIPVPSMLSNQHAALVKYMLNAWTDFAPSPA